MASPQARAGGGVRGGVESVAPDPVQEQLEKLLFEATNPENKSNNVNVIKRFCDTIAKSAEGPQLAARLLGHRVQSPQEQEALQALAVLEAAVKGCGEAFHAEVGKFRFLNEMIKLVSPKYLGSQRPEHIKQKVIELLYCWTREIPGEKKISEAYNMLKEQGVVREDPDYVNSAVFAASLPPRKTDIDLEQQQKLQKLLYSKNSEDLQTANSIIKSIVSRDEDKMERLSKRLEQLQSVRSSVKLLTELLDNHNNGGSSAEERQLIAELCSSCEKLRPGLYRLASEVAEDDTSIGEILAVSDDLTRVIDHSKELMMTSGGSCRPRTQMSNVDLLSTDTGAASSARSLLDLDPLSNTKSPTEVLEGGHSAPRSGLEELQELLVRKDILQSQPTDHLMAVFEKGDRGAGPAVENDQVLLGDAALGREPRLGQDVPLESVSEVSATKSSSSTKPSVGMVNTNKGLHDLDMLGESLIRSNLSGDLVASFEARRNENLPLNSLRREKDSAKELVIIEQTETKDLTQSLPKTSPSTDTTNIAKHETNQEEESVDRKTGGCEDSGAPEDRRRPKWSDISIEMTKITPNSSLPPLQLQEVPDGVSITLHFTTNTVSGWPSVAVLVATLSSGLSSEVTDLQLKPVLPRGCRVRPLPASSTSLPPCSPFTPRPAVTQVLLLDRGDCGVAGDLLLGYVFTYRVGEETVTDIGKDIPLPHNLWPH